MPATKTDPRLLQILSEFDSGLVFTDTAFEASGGASQYRNRSPASYTEGALDFSTVKGGKSVDLQVDLVPEGIFWEDKHFAKVFNLKVFHQSNSFFFF